MRIFMQNNCTLYNQGQMAAGKSINVTAVNTIIFTLQIKCMEWRVMMILLIQSFLVLGDP